MGDKGGRVAALGCLVGALVVTAVASCRDGEVETSRLGSTAAHRAASDTGPTSPPRWAQPRPAPEAYSSFSEVASKVTRSVVNLSVSSKLAPESGTIGDPADPFFDPEGPGFPLVPGLPFPELPRVVRGLGSGVIVSSDGYIVTNAHNVAHAELIEVQLPSGSRFTPKVIGVDAPSDLALLRIEAEDLPALPFGRSSEMNVGDVVLAVGNPFGIGQTVTMGIISALDRQGVGLNDYEEFIQTDAAINPGNSGGALVDMRGRLVGINSAIVSKTGSYAGIGFAIPVDMVRTVATALRDHGRVVRGWAGVMIQDVTPVIAEGLDLGDLEAGALVSDVQPGGPADRAGLRAEDVIVRVNGRPIRGANDLQSIVAGIRPGESAELRVLRQGGERSVQIVLGERADESAHATTPRPPAPTTDSPMRGIGVAPLVPRLREALGIAREVEGVLVASVSPDSPAARAGLRDADVITAVNRTPVPTPEAFARAVASAGTTILLRIVRQGTVLYIGWRGNGSP